MARQSYKLSEVEKLGIEPGARNFLRRRSAPSSPPTLSIIWNRRVYCRDGFFISAPAEEKTMDISESLIKLLQQLGDSPGGCISVGEGPNWLTKNQAQQLVDKGLAQWKDAGHRELQMSNLGSALHGSNKQEEVPLEGNKILAYSLDAGLSGILICSACQCPAIGEADTVICPDCGNNCTWEEINQFLIKGVLDFPFQIGRTRTARTIE